MTTWQPRASPFEVLSGGVRLTTFAKLITRLLDPVEGTVEIEGVPVNRVKFSSLRVRVAFVPQEGLLFNTTIADNIRYGRPEAGEREIRTAFL